MKTAVILFNLGAPDRPESVRPFLFNLFSDPAIIRAPWFVRYPLAWALAKRRTKKAQEIYDKIGGGSPLLPNTVAQAQALQTALNSSKAGEFRVFTAMRHWQPRAMEVALQVKDYSPTSIVLMPLYPQYSTTTSASSLAEWQRVARAVDLGPVPTKTLCCYPSDEGFVAAQTAAIAFLLAEARTYGVPRILFSAHGLPEKIVRAGDPYQWQCEQTARAIAAGLGGNVEWLNTYQSRVGPLEWIGPSTEDEVRRAGTEKKPVIVVPMSFVSEHSETLVELDMDLRNLANSSGVPYYGRAATVMADPAFINSMAAQVHRLMAGPHTLCSQNGTRICPLNMSGCPHKIAA